MFFFTSTVVDPPVTLFMGLDKHENEELIKWGWPEDVWFHVDKVMIFKPCLNWNQTQRELLFSKVSSAHVYLRLGPGQTLDEARLTLSQYLKIRFDLIMRV